MGKDAVLQRIGQRAQAHAADTDPLRHAQAHQGWATILYFDSGTLLKKLTAIHNLSSNGSDPAALADVQRLRRGREFTLDTTLQAEHTLLDD